MTAGEAAPGPRTDSAVGNAAAYRLYGRDRELGVLAALVGRLSDAEGGALVMRGEPGIGKSALLAAAAARARDHGVRLLSAVGVQSEARLPFAGLHQLLRPVLPLAQRLPARQRTALLAAFGMSDEAPSELFMIGLATLELISDTAASSPVLLIADDAQWLDEPSCAVLAFVARRLGVEPAAMLIGVRDGLASPFDDADLPELRLAGLSDSAAGALLDSRALGMDPVLRERLIAEAAGNPLALVELPEALRSEQLAGGTPLASSRLPLTARLERAFAVQESALPAATRSLLLVAAADDGGILRELLDAASVLDGASMTADAVAPAIAARLVEIHGTQLQFRHPLVRSAIYQAASVFRRQAAHAALAEVLAGQPERRVWHRAAASVGPDEQVAAELEATAVRAEQRGAIEVAVDALRRAAQLSDSPASGGWRLLRAAQMAFEYGRPELGLQLLKAAEPLDLPHEERILLSWLRESHVAAGWSGAAKIGSFIELAERLGATGHTDLVMEPLLTIALRCYWGNPAQEIRSAVIATAERLPLPENDPTLLTVLGWSDPVQRGALVNDRISRMAPDATNPAGMLNVGSAATAVWAWDLSLPFLETAVEVLRTQGRLGLLVQALVSQAWAAVHLAQGPLAVSAAGEASRLAREMGELRWAVAAELAQATATAERGHADAAESMVRAAEAVLLPMGANPMLALVQFARGRGAVVQQRYAEGFEDLRRALDPADPAYHPFVGAWGLADLIEAAINIGRSDEAATYLRQLEALASVTSGPLLRAEAAFARPLLAGDDTAEELYQTALEQGLANWPGYRSRMLFWYGSWLRRQRRAAESRAPLRAARDNFDALGFADLAERARQELRAAGESSSRRSPEAWDQLTAQELQIARMAAEGLSNREIGQRLYISHRTVGAHLHRIFPKLGITSRSQLHAAISA
jgi:DNA-binding CsgD family transcriptional regulator